MAKNPNILIGLKLQDIQETQKKLQNDIDKMSKKLNLNISKVALTDLDKQQSKLQKNIDSIGRKINLNISKVQLNDTDKNRDKIQRDISKIGKTLNLDISNVNLKNIDRITTQIQRKLNSISKNLTLDIRAGNLNGNFVNATNIVSAEKGFENISNSAKNAKENISSMRGELAKVSTVTNGNGALKSETLTYKIDNAKQAVEKYGTVTREVNGQLVESYGLVSRKITDNKEKAQASYESQERYLDGLLQKLNRISEISIKGNRTNENYDNSSALERISNLQNEINTLKEKGVLLTNQEKNALNSSIIELNNAVRSESGYAAEINKTTQFLEKQISILNDLKVKLNSRNDNIESRREVEIELDKEIALYRKLIEENEVLGNVERNRINSSTSALKTEVEGLNTYESKIKGILKEMVSFAVGGSALMAGFQVIKTGIDNIVEMNSAMVELKRVTNETADTYKNFEQQAINTAIEIGHSTQDIIKATSGFAQAGFDNFNDDKYLAKTSLIYSNVGDISEEESTKSLISTIQGFGLAAKDAMGIVDKFNAVSNKFSINAGGIGDALQRSASALHVAGNDVSQSVALITAANSVVQDPSRVGNGFKTISMNLRNVTTEAGKTKPAMQQLFDQVTNGQVKLTRLGKDGREEFRSTYDVISDLGKVWKNLNSEQQALLGEKIAGKNQVTTLRT